LLPIQDANSDRIIMMIDATLKIHLFPENEETKSLFNKHAKDIYFTSTNRSSSSISGFGMEPDSSKVFKL
jgi:hypothetical protein